jgi:CheY-like chemotaxis protein
MKRQIVHLVRLVDDLLDVSRIVSGKIHFKKEVIDVSTFVDRAIEEMQPILDGHGHELILTRPSRPILVNGDSVRLAQVVSNLLSNAARYTDKPSRIFLSVDTKGSEVEIRVRDSGVGIASEELTRIFNLFEQGDSTISRSRGGLGLGLTLVKRIMEMHGGSVMASSDGAQLGSEFMIRLPMSAANLSSAGTRHPKQSAAQSSVQRILVVDDNVDAVTRVERLLKLWGHQVQVAYNGKDGIDKALSFRPNIVFLDIGMPGMSGYDVAKQLRALPELDGVIITAVTGYGQAEDRGRSRDAGFNYHMTKPPNPTALAALIASPHTYIED